MIGRKKRMLLGHYLEEVHSQSAIARKLGISRPLGTVFGCRGYLPREETAAEPT